MNEIGDMEQRSLFYSVLLHVGVLIIALVGIPKLFPHPEEPAPMVLTVDILPITPVTNVNAENKQITRAQQAAVPPTPKPQPAPVAAPPKPVEQPKPDEPQPFNPNDNAKPQEATPPKPEQPKPQPTDTKQFDDVLKNLEKESQAQKQKNARDQATTPENTTRSVTPYDPSMQLGLSDKDAIRNQFRRCWRMPAGAKDPHSLAVHVHVLLKEDGSLISAELMPDQVGRYNSDSYFRAAADSALRAVHECTEPPMGPLKNLPADKYNAWKDMDFNFDPAELLD
ncbi:MAG: hypothetical protein WDN72_07485 [Alphaproteobacteria bacterium]